MTCVYLKPKGKALLLCEEHRRKICEVQVAHSDFSKAKGADGYTRGLDGKIWCLLFRRESDIPEGWTTKRRLDGRHVCAPKRGRSKADKELAARIEEQLDALPAEPSMSALAAELGLTSVISHEGPDSRIIGSQRLGSGFETWQMIFDGKDAQIYIVGPDVAEEVKRYRDRHPGARLSFDIGDGTCPEDFEQLGENAYQVEFHTARLEREKTGISEDPESPDNADEAAPGI